MRIGLVLAKVPGYSETFFHRKIEALQASGFEVVLFVGGREAPPADYPCRVVRAYPVNGKLIGLHILKAIGSLGCLLLRRPVVLKRYLKLERESGIGMVDRLKRLHKNAHMLCQKVDYLHFGFATMLFERDNVAEAIGARMTVSLRGYDVFVYPVKNGMDCYRRFWPKIHRIHVLSEEITRNAREQLGLPGDVPVTRIAPATDTGLFSDNARDLPAEGPVELLSVARLHWVKGLEYAIEAAALLKAGHLDFRLTIAGMGDEFEHLQFLVHLLELQDHVQLVGRKSREEVAELMRHSDIYLQPSTSEGFCNAVLEAQSCGLLCIVSDTGGLRENVLDDRTGWLVPIRDSRAIADKVQQVVSMDPIQRKQVQTLARKRVTESFNLEKHLAEWVDFYQGSH